MDPVGWEGSLLAQRQAKLALQEGLQVALVQQVAWQDMPLLQEWVLPYLRQKGRRVLRRTPLASWPALLPPQ